MLQMAPSARPLSFYSPEGVALFNLLARSTAYHYLVHLLMLPRALSRAREVAQVLQ
jgi:hypothetical protein